jgi:hypothetical protein
MSQKSANQLIADAQLYITEAHANLCLDLNPEDVLNEFSLADRPDLLIEVRKQLMTRAGRESSPEILLVHYLFPSTPYRLREKLTLLKLVRDMAADTTLEALAPEMHAWLRQTTLDQIADIKQYEPRFTAVQMEILEREFFSLPEDKNKPPP